MRARREKYRGIPSFSLQHSLRGAIRHQALYTLCATRCDRRVLVVIKGEHTKCTRDECKG